ncbi:hypothetical protein ZYGR_0AF03870 [Zygosaccharomyces rouxii]|uniref:tRNA (adenine(58)-N(1))-methyltransferase catalytic subunit TRM61 n=1 Tax=Zygosaccharomyces rouxii TaxID=4956 RepID=A0A1Q3A834_ZYGRO|nr:hypothetical protein ZYGR_0AF03870 [Zygosaccharomyces rouxii]
MSSELFQEEKMLLISMKKCDCNGESNYGQSLQRIMINRVVKRFQHTFQPYETVLARLLSKPNEKFHLSRPLKAGDVINTGNGPIRHEDVIGKPYRSLVTTSTSSSHQYMLCKPSLEEYVVNKRREAQPIYPLDAGSIVQLSDVHADFPDMGLGPAIDVEKPTSFQKLHLSDEYDRFLHDRWENRRTQLPQGLRTCAPPKQYLECGTGHGSLTLQICRAIHSGNAYYDGNDSTRGSILHSLDRSAKHLVTGVKNLKHYDRGIYWTDVEFHLLSESEQGPSQWLQGPTASYYRDVVGRLADRPGGFLNGAFLDLPSPQDHLETIAQHLVAESPLMVFVPSITQLWDCLQEVKTVGIPLSMTRVLELMSGSGGGGMREWDLRRTVIRETSKESMVARPKVGARIVGGGFVGVFKKLPADSVVRTWK